MSDFPLEQERDRFAITEEAHESESQALTESAHADDLTAASVVADEVEGSPDADEELGEERQSVRSRGAKDERKKWYVIHTYSGYENKVKANLERRIHSMNMQDKIFRVLVPMEDEVEFKDGKRKITPKKVFPGYVLVEMDMDDQSWYVVRNTSGVTGFVGSPGAGEKPVPLQDKEVKTILKQMGIETPKLKIDFKKGDRVKVTSGPFFDFTGIVDEIAPEKEKVRALISIFRLFARGVVVFGARGPGVHVAPRLLATNENPARLGASFRPWRRRHERKSPGKGFSLEMTPVE
jgi:transcriptional antiterminator NusG